MVDRSELFEVEFDGNIMMNRYVEDLSEDWFYDSTEVLIQEMILNIKHQING